MATFKEWQVAKLTAEEQVECATLCNEFQAKLEASGADLSTTPPTWPSEEVKAEFNKNVNPRFNEFYTRYELSK